MKYAIIENGAVSNIVESDSPLPGLDMVPAGDAHIGYLFDGTVFTAPEPAKPVVPESVSMRQAQLALLGADILDDVEALVATLPRAYQIEWNKASIVERTNPLVELVRQQKAMTVQQIDDLFILAATL